MILRIKKPDYIGKSQWIFRHKNVNFRANVKDEKWLEDFQGRDVELRPGDSIKAIVEIETVYYKKGDVIKENRVIKKVVNVMDNNNDNQKNLEF